MLFHSPPGVLFTFPSQYCFTIGHRVVFRLGGWSPHIPTGFHVPRGTLDTHCDNSIFAYGALTLCGRPSHAFRLIYCHVLCVRTPRAPRSGARQITVNSYQITVMVSAPRTLFSRPSRPYLLSVICSLLSAARAVSRRTRFGLFRFRSPLLSESRLISFPRPT